MSFPFVCSDGAGAAGAAGWVVVAQPGPEQLTTGPEDCALEKYDIAVPGLATLPRLNDHVISVSTSKAVTGVIIGTIADCAVCVCAKAPVVARMHASAVLAVN